MYDGNALLNNAMAVNGECFKQRREDLQTMHIGSEVMLIIAFYSVFLFIQRSKRFLIV